MPSAAPPSASSSAQAPTKAPSPLAAYEWDLANAYDAGGQAAAGWKLSGKPALRLNFENRNLSVKNLCNVVGAAYAIDGSNLRVERVISTMRACADNELMALERKVATQLPTAKSYSLKSGATPQLTVQFADGSRWELTGTPTASTQYGGPGERMFLEVAPERVACSNGVMKDAQCLRVRVVTYREDGVKHRVGAWENFYNEIEGYTHEPGIRNVLRVNRFVRQNVPADASRHVYVLDMVVESERAR
ncbi:META and DUF4377 domain-containing protein [Ottowia thiooxydans]